MKTIKMIAALMLMTITAATPATAKNKKVSHFDRVEMKASHFDKHHKHAYRPEVKTCTLVLGRHDSHKKLAAKADRMKGVIDTKWNPRRRELTIIYDAKVTSARHIRHFMA
jgi:hypothetical protein